MKSEVQKIFLNIVKNGIGPSLEQNGFKKKGLDFYKPIGGLGHIINIQKDKWNTSEDVKFTMNIGIFSASYWLSAFDFEGAEVVPVFPRENEAIVRKRIGEIKYGHDYWYDIIFESSTLEAVNADIEGYILPFLNQVTSEDELVTYLETQGEEYKLFIIYAERGELKKAEKLFGKLMKECPKRQSEYMIKKGMKYGFDAAY